MTTTKYKYVENCIAVIAEKILARYSHVSLGGYKNKISLLFLLICVCLLASCSPQSVQTPVADHSIPEPLGYDFLFFDSDGDGVKDDIAELTCLGMSGGYGSFGLEVFVPGEGSYRKVFDSERYEMDETTYQRLAQYIEGELMIDTIYSVEAIDTDGDGHHELVARQYAWSGSHSNHEGDVITVFKIVNHRAEVADVRLEELGGESRSPA